MELNDFFNGSAEERMLKLWVFVFLYGGVFIVLFLFKQTSIKDVLG